MDITLLRQHTRELVKAWLSRLDVPRAQWSAVLDIDQPWAQWSREGVTSSEAAYRIVHPDSPYYA